MKILIVDDSRAMRRIVASTIRQAGFSGHEIIEAENGQQALDLVHADFPDLILSDWDVPGISGIELLRTLGEEGYHIPFGFVTAEATDSMVGQAKDAGAVFLLAKPFTAEDMAQVLGVVISPSV
jgi:two-component system chemotaxis response regulator CheY